jgi:anti-sigma regulatory factor (Ser/Thr protein kinase)
MGFLTQHVDRPEDGPSGPLQIMYGIDGRSELPERELPHLEGYRGSAPVRVGNGAATQLQLDIYGALLDSVYLYDEWCRPLSSGHWRAVCALVDWVCENWDQPDEGVWETRGGRKRFLYSRLMCWVAIERAIRMALHRGLPAELGRWGPVRDRIYWQIMDKGWSPTRQAFVQYEGGDVLDAAVLMMPLTKFIAPHDPVWLSTLDALGNELVSDSLVWRYDPEVSPDGLEGDEGTFSICSFWYVEALTRAGRLDEARLAFEIAVADRHGAGPAVLGAAPLHLDDVVIRLATEASADTDTASAGDIGATCLHAVYDPVAGCCSLARAGPVLPAVVNRDGTVDFLDLPAGPPLGPGGLPFETAEIDLPEGSVIALYTNGLIEALDHDIEAGLTGLCHALAQTRASLETTCDTVLQTLLPADRPHDDVALLLARTHALGDRQVATWDVDADPAAVARARANVAEQQSTWGPEELEFTTELVVSELVTNAICYGRPPIRLRLIHDRTLMCEVADAGSTTPHLRRARVFDEGGRGLFLVAQLAEHWGTRHARRGKTVWAECTLDAQELFAGAAALDVEGIPGVV